MCLHYLKNHFEKKKNCYSFTIDHPKFKSTTPITEIFEAFKHETKGVSLLAHMPSFPSNVFASYDAIVWVHNNSESNCDPMEILENMRK